MSLEKLIEKHFKTTHNAGVGLKDLIDIVEEQIKSLGDKVQITEAAPSDPTPVDVEAGKKFVLSLPKFSPTENWGDPASLERGQVNQIFRAIGGGASLPEKLAFIKRLQEPDNNISSPRRVISTLIVLEALNATINSFGASTAGFVFEGFLAALLGGKQEAEVSEKGNLPIQDIIAFTEYGSANVPMSLKLLKNTTDVKGSYTNLIDALDEFQEMVYVVVYKEGGDREVSEIDMRQFVFRRDNFLQAITINSGGQKLVSLEGKSPQESLSILTNPELDWPTQYALLTRTAGYTGQAIPMPGEAPEQQEETPEEQEPVEVTAESLRNKWEQQVLAEAKEGGKTQWSLSTSQLATKVNDIIDYQNLGTLEVSPEKIYSTASGYLDILGDSVVDLFEAVANLSQNLNTYFVAKDRSKAIKGGEEAVKNAQVVEQEAAGQLSKEK
tara:strand:+ start:1664 stop:2986 length:1323 start_codon:yes stop_codon:yes gene_type:complete